MVDLDGLVQGSKTFSFPQNSERPSPTLIANAIGEMVSDSLSRNIPGQAVNIPCHSDENENRFLDQLLRGSHINRRERLIELRAAVLRYEQIISDDPMDQLSHRRLIGALGQFLSLAPGSISG